MTQAEHMAESLYRGIKIERRCYGSEMRDGQQVPVYSWVAQAGSWTAICPSPDDVKLTIDAHLDGNGGR
jgi:hypothetical protein